MSDGAPNVSPGNPAGDASRSGARTAAWMAFAVVMLWSFALFWVRTVPVRLANPDDVEFQDLVDRGGLAADLTARAAHQGRFYTATPLFPPLLSVPHSIREPWTFSFARTLLFFLQAVLLGTLVGRIARNAAAGGVATLLIIVTLHIPPTFYPILSYPPAGIGFASALVAFHAHLTAARGGGAGWRGLAGAAFLTSCLCVDVFIMLLPGFAVVSYHCGARSLRSLLRDNFVIGATAAAYAFAYLAFSQLHPAQYAGTRFAVAPGPAAGVLVRQFAGILPGFELVVNRIPECTTGPLFRPVAEVVALLRANTAADVALSVAAGLVVGGLLRHAAPLPRAGCWSAVLLAGALALNLPLAFAEKYQVFLYHRQFPYEYAFHSSCLLAGAVVVTLGHARGPRLRRWLAVGAGVAAGVACFSAQASNRHVLAGLQHQFNAPADAAHP